MRRRSNEGESELDEVGEVGESGEAEGVGEDIAALTLTLVVVVELEMRAAALRLMVLRICDELLPWMRLRR